MTEPAFVSPWWPGNPTDHLLAECPCLHRLEPQPSPSFTLINPASPSICGWCRRVWGARTKDRSAVEERPLIATLDDLPAVIRSKIRVEESGCWQWVGRLNRDGYGQIGKSAAYRRLYQLFVGPIPAWHHIDHECHNRDTTCVGGRTCVHRRCVRPDHLQAVEAAVNLRNQYSARKTHCVNGHEFTAENTFRTTAGYRGCRTCMNARSRSSERSREAASG